MTAAIVLDGWTLRVDGDEPRVRDLDLAERAGLAKPRNVRQVIKAAAEDGALNIARSAGGVREVKAGPVAWLEPETITAGNGAEREGEAFYLNEEGALLVLTRLRTKAAVAITRALVSVFVKVRRGEVPAVSADPASAQATSPELTWYYEAKARLQRAFERKEITEARLEAKCDELMRELRGIDVLAAPKSTGFEKWPADDVVSSAVASLPPGGSFRVTRNLDTSGHYKAGQIGKPFGLSGQFVGDTARELGIFEREGWGMKRRFEPNDGGGGFEHWLYNDKAKGFLTPHLEAERTRRKAAAEAKEARRASKQSTLPLGKRGAA